MSTRRLTAFDCCLCRQKMMLKGSKSATAIQFFIVVCRRHPGNSNVHEVSRAYYNRKAVWKQYKTQSCILLFLFPLR